MEDIINLQARNRDDTNSYLTVMKHSDGVKSNTYKLHTNSAHIRFGYLDNHKKFIDISGGPMIIEGQLLKETDIMVDSIDYIAGYGYTITFK